MSAVVILALVCGLSVASPAVQSVDRHHPPVREGVHQYPSLAETPHTSFITHLGPDLTNQIVEAEFSDTAISQVVKEMFRLVDTNNDHKLDKGELKVWLEKNNKINQAVEIKEEFLHCDENGDSKVTFKEHHTRGTDPRTVEIFTKNFMDEQGGLNMTAINQAIPAEGHKLRIIHDSHTLFTLCDQDEDGGLSWYEYVMFSRPSDFALTHTQVTGKHSGTFDEDGDMRYNRDEFEAYFSHQVPLPNLLPEDLRDSKTLFVQCDKEGDGLLSYQEAHQCVPHSSVFVNHENTEWMMMEADENDDGVLTEDEVVRAFEGLAHGDDYWAHDEL